MKVTVAITGASGAIYANRLIEKLCQSQQVDFVYVVFSVNGLKIFMEELGLDNVTFPNKCKVFKYDDFSVPIASGSNVADAMVICPCSGATMAKVAAGIDDNLIIRAAGVALKERKKLVIVLRETPYSLVHIRNMETLTLAGSIILPASPSFYSLPKTLFQLVDTVVDRILSHIGIDNDGYRWGD